MNRITHQQLRRRKRRIQERLRRRRRTATRTPVLEGGNIHYQMAEAIADPTTAGDFCRRFGTDASIVQLMEAFNAARLNVWRQQPPEFFERAVIDADGTLASTFGQCKQGMDISYKGDWGYHLGEKGHWGKHTLWERTSNVPFIWAGPGVAKGAKPDVTVSLIDMYPTFVEMCGLPAPRQKLEGRSLKSTLAKPDAAKDRDVYLPHMTPGEYAIITRDWRYIRYGDDGEELYDLRADPNEWTNLADRAEHADVKARLRALAPKSFAKPGTNLNTRKDLKLEGDTFRWVKGEGNYTPQPKHLPYSDVK